MKKNSIAFYFTVNSLLDFVITNFWNSFSLSCSLQLDLVSNYFRHWFDRQDDYHRRLRCRIEPLNIWVLSFISLQNFFSRRIERINKNSEEKLKNLLMGFLTRCISYEHSIADVCGSGVCVFDSTNFTPFTGLGIHMKRKKRKEKEPDEKLPTLRYRNCSSNHTLSKIFQQICPSFFSNAFCGFAGIVVDVCLLYILTFLSCTHQTVNACSNKQLRLPVNQLCKKYLARY